MDDDGRLTVLILGGYGTFGGRLAQLLAAEPRLTLQIAGRSASRAAAFCQTLPPGAARAPLVFDRNGDLEAQIADAQPDVLVDASGPFQAYGADPYRLVRACIARGVSYLDLADGSTFVKGVVQFDDAARRRGVAVLSGVSSFPVLTAAVVRALSRDLKQVETIVGGIAPSPYAGVGLNVIRAIAGYAGKPVALIVDGQPATGFALTKTVRHTIAPPGRTPLRSTLFSLVDVPDLQVLPELWPGLTSIWMGAGPVPESLHRMLIALSWLVRLRLLASLEPFAPVFHWASNTLRWGENRGGMFVTITGRSPEGRTVERTWSLLAEGEDGPLIPSMAAEAIIRRSLQGRSPRPGARPGTQELELIDYEALFSGRDIHVGVRQTDGPGEARPLYSRLLGAAWARLPQPVRALHDLRGSMTAVGVADVERGKGLLALLAAQVFRFPPAARQTPLTVYFKEQDGRETWTRDFGGRRFSSVQSAGAGRLEGLLCERFGPLHVAMALVVDGPRLRLIVRSWRLFGLPMPLALAPSGEAYETAEDGRFSFNVEIRHPWTGLIVQYRGWLALH